MAPLQQASTAAVAPRSRSSELMSERGRAWPLLRGSVVVWLGVWVVLASGLRLHRLDTTSLWGDEACMLELVRSPAAEIVRVLVSDRPDVDVAPPLYFLALRGFTRVLGLTVHSARLMSVLFGLACVVALFVLVRITLDEATAHYAVPLLAVSAFHVWYAQEARMYTMVTLLGLLSTIAFYRVMRRGRGVVLYVLLSALAMYTQYYAYLLVFAQLVVALLFLLPRRRQERDRLRAILIAAGSLLVIVLPWMVVVARDLRHASEPGFPSNFSLLSSIPFVFAKFALFGNEQFVRDTWPLYVALAPFFGWYFLRGILALSRDRVVPWLYLGLIALPMAAVVVGATAGLPLYKSHPFILFSPYFYILVGHGLSRARGWRGPVVMTLFLAANIFVMARLNFGDTYTKPKVKEALTFVGQRMEPSDLLLKLPAKLHQQPVETGEILSWRFHAPARLEIRELNGRDLPDLERQLAAQTANRSRFFFAVAETQFTRDLTPALLEHAQRHFKLVESAPLPSRIRDFGLTVYLFERVDGRPGGARDFTR